MEDYKKNRPLHRGGFKPRKRNSIVYETLERVEKYSIEIWEKGHLFITYRTATDDISSYQKKYPNAQIIVRKMF